MRTKNEVNKRMPFSDETRGAARRNATRQGGEMQPPLKMSNLTCYKVITASWQDRRHKARRAGRRRRCQAPRLCWDGSPRRFLLSLKTRPQLMECHCLELASIKTHCNLFIFLFGLFARRRKYMET